MVVTGPMSTYSQRLLLLAVCILDMVMVLGEAIMEAIMAIMEAIMADIMEATTTTTTTATTTDLAGGNTGKGITQTHYGSHMDIYSVLKTQHISSATNLCYKMLY